MRGHARWLLGVEMNPISMEAALWLIQLHRQMDISFKVGTQVRCGSLSFDVQAPRMRMKHEEVCSL